MEKFAEFSVKHPMVIASVFGVLAGYATFATFRAGYALGILAALDESARAASEALGG